MTVVLQHSSTILHEPAPKEEVGEVDIEEIDDEVGDFTEKILKNKKGYKIASK